MIVNRDDPLLPNIHDEFAHCSPLVLFRTSVSFYHKNIQGRTRKCGTHKFSVFGFQLDLPDMTLYSASQKNASERKLDALPVLPGHGHLL